MFKIITPNVFPASQICPQKRLPKENRLLVSSRNDLDADGHGAAAVDTAALGEVEVGALAGDAAGASSDGHQRRPGTAGAALEVGTVNAQEVTLGSAGRARSLGTRDGSRSRGGRLLNGSLDRLLDGSLNRSLNGGLDGSLDGGLSRRSDGSRTAGRAVAGGATEGAGTGVAELNRVTGVGELEVGALGGRASVVDVGSEHVGELVDEALAAAGASDSDGGAVHVHLTVADLVEPSPGKSVLAGSQVGGDLEVVGEGDGSLGVVTDVAGSVTGRAATLNGVDDLPDGVAGGGEVGGDGDLARTTTVDGSALEGEGLGAALGVAVGDAVGVVGDRLAGEVGAVGEERAVVDSAVGNRVGHEDVSASNGNQSGERESLGEHLEKLLGIRKVLEMNVVEGMWVAESTA